MATKKNKAINVIGLVILGLAILLLFSYFTERPIFLGALTSFTQTGNELKYTNEMVENGTAVITRELRLQHGNVTSAHIDIFATPTITSAKFGIGDDIVWTQTVGEQMINVVRIDITEKLKRETCNNCIVYFKFYSDEVGSILVTELNVDLGGNPNINQTANNGPDPIQIDEDEDDNVIITEPVIPEQQVIQSTQQQSQSTQKILIIVIIVISVYLYWEKGSKRGFFKSI